MGVRTVRTRCGFGQDDSGGPTYTWSGDAYLVSITALYYGRSATVCGGADFGPDSSGTGAYPVENSTSVSVRNSDTYVS